MSYSECVEAALRHHGIPYVKVKESGHDAPKGKPFSALLGELCRRDLMLCRWPMYLHQERALQELMAGGSVILASETGSGKTEPVIGYVLNSVFRDPHFKAMFIYPTKALAGDQVRRFAEYAREAGLEVYSEDHGNVKVIKGDVVRYDNDVGTYVRKYVNQAKVLLTNAEVFHIAVYNRFSRQYPPLSFLLGSKLVVIDELDSYGSSRAGLLIHMLKLLRDKFKLNPQLAIMSATIGESKELERYLGATLIAGQGYRPDNYVYVLLPPGFTETCAKLGTTCDLGNLDGLKNVMLKVLSSKELVSAVSTQLKALRGYVPRVLADIVKCQGSTLIFTNSIAEATKLSKEVSIYAGFEVPVHSHLTSRHRRAEIEEGLRTGRLRAAFTVRTLLQGIDIGHITRVVHVGLPRFASVRDFIQREGRKGRTQDVASTESIIVPTSLDDLIILADLYTWLSRGPEKLIFVPDNDFFKLNDVVFGLVSDPVFEHDLGLTDKEKEQLRKKLSFYGTEYGRIKRILATWNEDTYQCKEVEEDISQSDFINYFQPGAFDSYTDSLVIWYDRKKDDRKKGLIFEVPVKDLREASKTSRDSPIKCGDRYFYMPSFLKRALEDYFSECSKLGERRRCDLDELIEDYYNGKLWSKVIVDLAFTSEGFVRGQVVPSYVMWFLESRDRVPVVLEDGSIVHLYKVVPAADFDPYFNSRRPNHELFTYAYAVDLEPGDLAYINMAMSFIQAVLRKSFGVSLSLINYSYSQGLLKVWESEPVGLLKKLRAGEKVLAGDRELSCESLLSEVKSADVEHDEYMKFLLRYLDPLDFGRSEVLGNLKAVKDAAERFVYYICNMIPAVVENNVVLVSREWPQWLTVIDYFNGKYIISRKDVIETADDVKSALEKAFKIAFPNGLDLFSNIKIIYYGPPDEKLEKMVEANYLLRVIFINLTRTLKGLASGDPRPFMLSGVRRKVFGKDDLTELELKVNSEALLSGRVDDEVFREVGLKRAETIAWLYNLYTKLSNQGKA